MNADDKRRLLQHLRDRERIYTHLLKTAANPTVAAALADVRATIAYLENSMSTKEDGQ
jgi:hypothetical protein